MKQIRSLPRQQRPREKLLKNGPESLSLAELISVILITGNKNYSVLTLAAKIAKILKKSSNITPDIKSQLNLGPTKISQIQAVIEISRRLNQASQPIVVTKAEQIYALSSEIASSAKEILLCFYFNARGELLKKEIVAIGTYNKANLLPGEIFYLVKELPVFSIILVHNHPSGDLEPSTNDLRFTRRIKLAGDILGVKLLDHLIVTPNGWKKIPL